MQQKRAVILGRDPAEDGECEHARSELRRRHLPAGSERAHRLMIEQRVRQPAFAGRLNPVLFDVELHESNSLDQLPRDALRQHRPRQRRILAHDEPHLLRKPAPAGPAHALQERGHCERRIDLKSTFQPPNVDPKLEGRRRDGRQVHVVVLHELFRGLAIRSGEIAVMNEKTVVLPARLAVLPQRRCDAFRLLAGVAEDEALPAARVLKDISDAGIRAGGRSIGRLSVRRKRKRGQYGSVCFFGFTGKAAVGSRCFGADCICVKDRRSATVPRRCFIPALCGGSVGVEVFHRQAPGPARCGQLRDHDAAPGPGSEKTSRGLRISDRRGEADPARAHARHAGEALDEAQRLQAAVAAHQ